MTLSEERGRPIWFNQAEQRVTLKALESVLLRGTALTKDELFILKPVALKMERYVQEQNRSPRPRKR